MRGLYPIVDVDVLARAGLGPVEFLEALLRARPALVQLRAKRASARETLALLRAFRPHASAAGCKLFANDRPDLALLAGADGVHLGQSDIAPEQVRRHFPGLAIGLSTHTLPELDRALAHAPDYVAYGPVFRTSSKENPEPVVGLAGLCAAAERVAGRCPLVAIGGISSKSAARVARIAEFGAVIGALVPTAGDLESVARTAVELHSVLLDGRE